MKWLTRWFLENPVAANLLMAFMLVGGYLSLSQIRVESFPQLPPSEIVVEVVHPGASIEQVDSAITQRLEASVSSLPGIARTTSESRRGYAVLTIKRNSGVDLDKLLSRVRDKVENINGLPSKAEKPRIYANEFTNLAAYLTISGQVPAEVLQKAAIKVERALKAHPQISQVKLEGKRSPQLIVEPRLEALVRYGVSLENIKQALHGWSGEYFTGELSSDHEKIVLQTKGKPDSLVELKGIPIRSLNSGEILLSQVADVHFRLEESEVRVQSQGRPALVLEISTSSKDHLLRISEAIQEVSSRVSPELPQGVRLQVMADMAPYIIEQLGRLGTNAWQGLLIVVIILGLFLDLKLAFWVAFGIPISLAGTLWAMDLPILNYSINDITLFGMILVLGILVDDAVVVGESIYEARKTCDNPQEAAWKGVEKVAVATVFGVLTTIAAFSPMLWIDNDLARVLAGFSAIVIIALSCSLIESKFILPAHLAHGRKAGDSSRFAWFKKIQARCQEGLNHFTLKAYLPILQSSLKYRASVLVLFISALILSYGFVFKGYIKTAFFPEIPSRYLSAKLSMQQGATSELSAQHCERLQAALDQVNQRFQQKYQLEAPPVSNDISIVISSSMIEITAELSQEAVSTISGNDFLHQWKRETGRLEAVYSLQFSASDNPGGATGLSISANDRAVAKQLLSELKKSLSGQPGVLDIYDDSQDELTTMKAQLTEKGRRLGITRSDLAILLGDAFGGYEVTRFVSQGEESKLLIRLPKEQRRHLEQLERLPLPVSAGNYLSLGEIAELSYHKTPEVIRRRHREPVLNLYWKQDRTIASPEQVLAELERKVLPKLRGKYPGAKIKASGEFEEIAEVQSGFKKALLMTILLIYALLAIPLKSYSQPLIIMSVIPFGFAGSIFGHGVMGLPVSVLSLFGMMAMTGIVINDSLVLMTRFNQLRQSKLSLSQALIEAGRSRMRAIFLTTVTTVCGLLPLLSETSEQAQYLKPAAVSLVFGELFATPITLILVPILLQLFSKTDKSEAKNA